MNRVIQQLRADSPSLQHRLHEQLFNLISIHPNEAFYRRIGVNKGLAQPFRALQIIPGQSVRSQFGKIIIIVPKNGIEIQPVIEYFYFGQAVYILGCGPANRRVFIHANHSRKARRRCSR